MKIKLNILTCPATLLAFALFFLDTNFFIARAQGTAFTYQGRLNDAGLPANGNYDLTFTLFGVSSGGSAIAGPLTNSPTGVTNGVFTVSLDFGNPFPGGDRWLEIGVRANSGSAFTILNPRQRITATPYAIQSVNAASAVSVSGSVSAAQLAGTIPAANIGAGSITSVMLADGSIHSNHLGVGSVHSNALVFGSIHSNHLAAGSVHSNALALGSVTERALADGSIHSNHLSVRSVHSNALALASIHSNHLAAGSVHSNALALGSVTELALALGSVHSNHLAVGSVHSNALALGSVTAFALADGSIHSNHLSAGSVHSNALVFGSIHSNHLAAGSVHSNALALGSVTERALADGSIHSNHLSVGSVHSNALVLGSIHSDHLAIGSVHSNALALGSVTELALAPGSIHSNHLAVGSVHSNILALGSVTAFALADGSIHSNHLSVGSVHSNALVFGSIHSNHLAAGSVHSNALALGSVTELALALGSVHSNHLAVGSVHSNALALGSVTATALASGSIHSNHIAVGSIHSNALALGSVTATALSDGAIHSNHLTIGSVNLNTLSTAVGGSFSTTLPNPNPGFFVFFGSPVAAVGSDTVLVGAYQDSTGADNAGAAYLLNTSGALVRAFLSPIPQNQEHFGFAVASIGPDKVLIGADGNNTGGLNSGAAHLFSTSGALITTFTNPTPAASDSFGYSVAAVGADKVLIGAPADHFGANLGGAAYLLTTNRTLLTTFTNPAPTSGDRFGIAVAAVGTDRVLIGADRDDAGATDSGIAYLFHINGTLLATFNNPTPANNDFFGAAVAAVGADAVLIGAPADNSNGNAGGAAYLFNTSGALLIALTNPTPAIGDQFGIAVAAIGGDKMLIGASSDDAGATDAGAAYIFSANGTLWSTMNNPAPAVGDSFGSAVTTVGDGVVIGAPLDDGGGVTDSGAVHLFALKNYLPGLALDPTIGVWQRSGANVYYNGGNVGIGTSDPQYPLDVAGTVRISNQGAGAEILNLNTERTWSFRQLGSGAGAGLELASVGGGGNKNFVINTTGLVGIGTTTPQATLHVAGINSNLRLQESATGNYWTIYTENHPSGADGNLLFVPGPSGVFAFIQKSTGNYFSGSDERLKTDIRCLSGVLDRVLQLRPVSYRFKSAPESATPAFGFIAQEVEPLFPEVVNEHDGMKSLAYAELVPVAIGAIQELNQKVEKRANHLEQELKRRDAEIAELRQTVNELQEAVKAMNQRLDRDSRLTRVDP